MNDFEKLDTLVKRNIPEAAGSLPPLALPSKNKRWIFGVSLAGSFCFLFIVLSLRTQTQLENTIALTDALSWDLTSDEGLYETEVDFDL